MFDILLHPLKGFERITTLDRRFERHKSVIGFRSDPAKIRARELTRWSPYAFKRLRGMSGKHLPGPGKLRGILIGEPVVRREFDTPETRARREKFNSDTHALVRRIAQRDHSTYLFFFGDKIGEDNIGA